MNIQRTRQVGCMDKGRRAAWAVVIFGIVVVVGILPYTGNVEVRGGTRHVFENRSGKVHDISIPGVDGPKLAGGIDGNDADEFPWYIIHILMFAFIILKMISKPELGDDIFG